MPDPIGRIKRSREKAQPVTGAPARPDSEDGGPDAVSEAPATSFHNILSGVSSNSEKKLEAILGDIKQLSGILVRRRLLEDLQQYRQKVGEFLKVYLDEVLDLREASGRKGTLRRKQLIVVKRIDVELEELSRLVMGGAPDFKIMKELGALEGLLMDLYH
jgi:uncharacterized protein YaaR (DUF327 family)